MIDKSVHFMIPADFFLPGNKTDRTSKAPIKHTIPDILS